MSKLIVNPLLAVTTFLTLAVILVNGWTDAPNAIATCVSTRSMKPRQAVIMAALFNFFGVFVMTSINATVAQTIFNMVDFKNGTESSTVALCAALVSIVLWAVAAWCFGIPTSESHALIAGLSGAAIALHGGTRGINGAEWLKVIYGLALSVAMGFLAGWVTVKLVEALFMGFDHRHSNALFQKAQIFGGAGMAFMHGAQDGQKFIGVFMLAVCLSEGSQPEDLYIPLWLMLSCSILMAFGTSIGGYRIIKSVGMDMVKLKKYQGFSADLASALCLLIASLFGLPVSTTHTKTTAIMGVGTANRMSSVNWGIVKNMMITWLLTFPGCGAVGYFMSKLFLRIFGG